MMPSCTYRIRRSSQRPQWLIAACCCLAVSLLQCESTLGYQISMARSSDVYKPPVKSSVGKLQNRRSGLPASRRTAKSSYAGTMSAETTLPSFESRMRNLVMAPSPRTLPKTSRRHQQTDLPANVQAVETLKDYKLVVGDEREKIVAVRFYASYCKACKAVAPHFYRMASEFPGVIFVDVPVTPYNAALHQGLGVPTLPYSHIYQPAAGLVEEQRLTRKDVASFKEKLQSYVNGCCPIPEDDLNVELHS